MEQTMTSVLVYDSTRLPHWGAIDYPGGAESVALSDASVEAYVEACERYAPTADEDGYLAPDRRDMYEVTVAATMTVVESGEQYDLDKLLVQPGDLRWAGMPAVCEQVSR